MHCFYRNFDAKIVLILLFSDVLSEDVLDGWIPELYKLYRSAIDEDKNFTSLRRDYSNNREYVIHVQKLKQVNGLKTHNLEVKDEKLRKKPIIYINNPVESKIPTAYLTIDDFRTALIKRIKEDRERFEKSKRIGFKQHKTDAKSTYKTYKEHTNVSKHSRTSRKYSKTKRCTTSRKLERILKKDKTFKSSKVNIFMNSNVDLTVEIKDITKSQNVTNRTTTNLRENHVSRDFTLMPNELLSKSSSSRNSESTFHKYITEKIEQHTSSLMQMTNYIENRENTSANNNYKPTNTVGTISSTSVTYENLTSDIDNDTDNEQHFNVVHSENYSDSSNKSNNVTQCHDNITSTIISKESRDITYSNFVSTTKTILNPVDSMDVTEKTDYLRTLNENDHLTNALHLNETSAETETTTLEDTNRSVNNASNTTMEIRDFMTRTNEKIIAKGNTSGLEEDESSTIPVIPTITRKKKKKTTKLTTKWTRRTQGRPYVFLGA